MTDDSQATDAQQAAGPTAVMDVNTAPDPILRAMAETAAEDKSFELGLTLHVSGIVVSGLMVSPETFFENLAAWLSANGGESFANSFAKPTADLIADDPHGSAWTDFIYLRNAQVFASGSAEPLPKSFWRGRLTHVSAWSIGSLGKDSSAR
jgi:hypothetical protein